MKKVIILLVFALLLLGAWKISEVRNKSVSGLSKSMLQEKIITPTPVPFVEMTIPHLRSREYKSEMGGLETLSTNPSYTSFLTSYTSDSLNINSLLTKPTGQMPQDGWPAIIFIHGYIPPTEYRTTEKYVAYVDSLARSGFVVLKTDLRGHGSSDGEPGGAYYSSDYIVDVLSAHAALGKLDFVNPKRIGLWGHSMAGNVVVRTLAVKPDIAASVIWAGAVFTYEDMQKYGLSDNSYRPPLQTSERQRRRQKLFDTHGEFDAANAFWETVTPMNYLQDLKGTISLHHAVNDEVVSINYMRDFVPILEKNNVKHEVYEYESGGHNIDGTNFGVAMQRTIDFYKKNL